MTHSPLPWRVDSKWPAHAYGANGYRIFHSPLDEGNDKENAALIVHRVNTYDALVEALENLCAIDDIAAWATEWEAARATLALAKETPK